MYSRRDAGAEKQFWLRFLSVLLSRSLAHPVPVVRRSRAFAQF